MENLSYVYKHI